MFRFYVVTRSYSSHLFLCALGLGTRLLAHVDQHIAEVLQKSWNCETLETVLSLGCFYRIDKQTKGQLVRGEWNITPLPRQHTANFCTSAISAPHLLNHSLVFLAGLVIVKPYTTR